MENELANCAPRKKEEKPSLSVLSSVHGNKVNRLILHNTCQSVIDLTMTTACHWEAGFCYTLNWRSSSCQVTPGIHRT